MIVRQTHSPSQMPRMTRLQRSWRFMLVAQMVGFMPSTAVAQPAAIIESILAAWKTADLVCLGEDHGRVADSDLRHYGWC
jgi:hypothetical protein